MDRSIILIRCINFSKPVEVLLSSLQTALPGKKVIAVPDLTNRSIEDEKKIIDTFPIQTLPLTKSFLDQNSLPSAGTRTGWLCGDYVLYRALEIEWKFAWVIEPDVVFLNGAETLLKAIDEFDHSLLATNFNKAGPAWNWSQPLAHLLPDTEIFSMAFPLLRASRNLVNDCLMMRQGLENVRSDSDQIPNDESIVATTARKHGYSQLDLRSLFPSLFTYWSTSLKFPLQDIKEQEKEARIVHSAVGPDHFQRYMRMLWQQSREGSSAAREKVFKLTNHMSTDSMNKFLAEALEL